MLDRIVGKKVIGIKQSTKLIKNGEGKVLYVAKDANAKLISPIIQLAEEKNIIFAIGNAPTALIRLYELIKEGKLKPALIIGAPVGFVNVVESKELIMEAGVPFIVPKGRKGGSNIAATICNAMLYQL